MQFRLDSLALLCLLFPSSAYAGKVNKAPAEKAIDGQYIVVFEENTNGGQVTNLKGQRVYSEAQMNQIAQEFGAQVISGWTKTLSGMAIKTSPEIAERLSDHPDVKYVDQNAMVSKDVTWGLDRIDQRELPLDNTFIPQNSGAGIRSYILDTGIRITHNEFEGFRAEWGENFVGDGIDDDCDGHGTHVAGTVAGATYGVGKDTVVVAVKVLGCSGSGSWAGVIDGCEWAAADAAAHPESAATANLSLGGGYVQSVNDAVGNLHDSGVVTVVAAGNSNANACNYSPASEPRVITVGSTTSSDARSSFSNYGTCVDIFAPGSSITSAWYTSDSATNTISGTSMASPHVAGVAGLALTAGVAPEDVTDELINSATVDVVTNPGPSSPNLLLFSGDAMPTVSPAPSFASSASPSVEPSISASPTVSCGDVFVVSIMTDRWYFETGYTLENNCTDELVFSRDTGYYTARDTLYVDEFCSYYNGGEYEFTIYDTYGDGICCGWGDGFYEVTLNGDIVASGGSFTYSETTTFGSCDPPAPCADSDLLVPFQSNLYDCDTIVGADICMNPVVVTHCPLGCDACDAYACEDSEAPWSVFGGVYNCEVLAAQSPEDIELYCDEFDLTTTCRGTCGYC